MLLLLTALACYPTSAPDTSGDPEGGTTCSTLTSGSWTVTGPAWNMGDNPMDGDLTFDAETCAFTLGNWDMTMDDLPSGGVVDGTTVQLLGANTAWETCTGEVTGETAISGTCADDGDTFEMVAKE